MSDCRYGPLVSAYHDRELDAARSTEVEAHLRECTDCARELAHLRGVTSFITSSGSEATPHLSPVGRARLKAGIDAIEHGPAASAARRLRFARMLTAAAAAVFLLSVAGIVYQQQFRGGTMNPINPVIEVKQPTTDQKPTPMPAPPHLEHDS